MIAPTIAAPHPEPNLTAFAGANGVNRAGPPPSVFAKALQRRSDRASATDQKTKTGPANPPEPNDKAHSKTAESADEAQNQPDQTRDRNDKAPVKDRGAETPGEKDRKKQSAADAVDQNPSVKTDTPPAGPGLPANGDAVAAIDTLTNSKTQSASGPSAATSSATSNASGSPGGGAGSSPSAGATAGAPVAAGSALGDPSQSAAVPASDASQEALKQASAGQTQPGDQTSLTTDKKRDASDNQKHAGVEAAQPSSQDARGMGGGDRVNPVDIAQPAHDAALGQGGNRPVDSLTGPAHRSDPGSADSVDPAAGERLFASTVSRGLDAALRHNGGSVTIRLKPESLGALRIDLNIEQGVVSAQFQVTTAQAHDLLSKHLATLRSSLEAKGFGVHNVEIQVHASARSGDASSDFGRSSQDAPGHSPADNPGAGAQGQPHTRREDPGGVSYSNQSVDPFAEDERIDTGWRPARAGGINTVA